MNKILIVDDEEKIREVIVEYAKFNNYIVDTAENGEQAVEKALKNDYDCIVMDIMMPYLDGFEASKLIRSQKDTPIILLSAKSEEYDILKGFDLGADDYIVKPFSPKQLMAKIKAILARTNSLQEIVASKEIKVDILQHSVTVNDYAVKLTNKEYDILLYLIKNKNKVVSREELISQIYKDEVDVIDRTIDAHIKMLRKDLKESGERIKTIRGVGYKLDE